MKIVHFTIEIRTLNLSLPYRGTGRVSAKLSGPIEQHARNVVSSFPRMFVATHHYIFVPFVFV